MQIKMGVNWNSLHGNSKIPEDYVVKKDIEKIVYDQLNPTFIINKPDKIRTLLWTAERTDATTPWLHIPLIPEEVDSIAKYWNHINTELELAFGPLWHGRINDPRTVNPYPTIDEVLNAYKESLLQLMYKFSAITPNRTIDLWNEFDLLDNQQELVKPWFMWAANHIKGSSRILGIPVKSTISVIIPEDGSSERALNSLNYLFEGHTVRPDFIELHINGLPNDVVVNQLPKAVDNIKSMYGLDISFGECDINLSWEALAAIASCNPIEFLVWRK
jgi:hypothetical protein